MSLPRVYTDTTDAQPVRSAATDSTTAAIAIETLRGPVGIPTVSLNMTQWEANHGPRTGINIPAHNAAFVLFREGAARVVTSRVIGATPVAATANIAGATATSLTISAVSPGEWANGAAGGLAFDVDVAGSDVTLKLYLNGLLMAQVTAQTRADLVTAAAANATFAKYAALGLGADTTLPVATASNTNLAGGAADLTNVTPTQVRAAVTAITVAYGPLQVLAPGRTTAASLQAVAEGAQPLGRVLLGNIAAGQSAAAVISIAATLRALGTGATGLPRLIGLWAQDAVGPGPFPGSSITVPWSVVEAGILARVQRDAGHPNVAAAGTYGRSQWAQGVNAYWSEADADALTDAGVNVVEEYLGPRNATFISVDNPATSNWGDLAHSRVAMDFLFRARAIGREFQGRVLSADGIVQGDFGGRLRDVLEDYLKRSAIFGDSTTAYRVDVGPSVNTIDRIAAGEIWAEVGVRMSPHVDDVHVILARVPITQAV
jgi:hypothetical protein